MDFKHWVPEEIVKLVKDYEEYLQKNDLPEDVRSEFSFKAEMWKRLATRPEMERIWQFMIKRSEHGAFPLHSRGGLVGRIERGLDSFKLNPRLSEKDYENEMLEIAKMAGALANKLRKFCEAESFHNPFSYSGILSIEQRDHAKKMIRPELLENKYGNDRFYVSFNLDHHLPLFSTQLENIADRAKNESREQEHRLKLPRKSNDKNVFRTYLIRLIGEHFFVQYTDDSPSRIATFCSVALDDPEITADLVRKTYILDDECKAMAKAYKEHLKTED
ncbi:hypothetical protein [Noviherbaspirillum sp.]|jgi:uncharacterized protein YcgL (UPF0745 family)|uniref:hypothetical protein n=1 Tax=Noviherbaspirillum sp. TaxID=1926288 RepID=UPI0025E1126F|nr:hypothetical protein [Noviherbaspirillum sp.]